MGAVQKILPISEEENVFFQDFYIANKGLLLHTVKQYASHKETCEDMMQDTLLRLIGHIPALKRMNTAVTRRYIALTVKSVYIDEMRRKEQFIILPLEDFLQGQVADYDADPFAQTANPAAIRVRHLRSCMPSREWTTLQAKYGWGCTDAEIGKMLQVSESHVRVILYRAKKRARKLIEERLWM